MANKNVIEIKVNDKIYFIDKELYNKHKQFIKNKEIEFENNACNAFKTIDKYIIMILILMIFYLKELIKKIVNINGIKSYNKNKEVDVV